MKRLFLVLGTAAIVLPWLTTARVHAEMIQWTASGTPIGPNFNSSNGTASIYSNFGDGAIGLLPGTTQNGTNSGSVIALDVIYAVNPDSSEPAKFGGSSANYSLSLTLTDAASGASGSLTFSGNLSGEIGEGPSDLWNTYLGPTTQSLKLGQNLYTVTMGSYVNGSMLDPVAPTGTDGTISANISVQPIGPVSPTPEPSTLLLACLGLPPLGLARWLRRRRKDVDSNS